MRPNFPNFRRRWFDFAILAVLVLACFGPFLGRAFHIDDPLFVWAARHIAEHPLDFFGFNVLWYDSWEPMWQVTQNPPLGCYYLALFGWLFGFSEPVLHAAMLLPAWAALLGTYHLAARVGARPLPAALLTLTTPAFLVCGVSVMCDVPMLALWLWTIVVWDIGLRERRPGMLYVAAVLIVVTTVTKYFGICLLPLLTAYSLAIDRDGWRRWARPLALAVALLIVYQATTWAMYGKGLLGGAMGYAATFGTPSVGTGFFRIFSSHAFLGGCVGAAAFATPLLIGRAGRRTVSLAAAITLAVALFLSTTTRMDNVDWTDSPFAIWGQHYCGPKVELVSQFVIWASLGVGLLVLAWQDYNREREPIALLLGLWIAGTFVFAAFVNWTLNGRSILPLVPAVAILLVRRLDGAWPERWPGWLLPTLLIPSAALAVTVAWADTTAANAQSRAAERIIPVYRGDRPLWVSGHWGWQYYAMEHGGVPWDGRHDRGQRADLIVVPDNNCNLAPIKWKGIEELAAFEQATCDWLTTMHYSTAAGFYAEVWGPLPFAFGKVPPEQYSVRKLKWKD